MLNILIDTNTYNYDEIIESLIMYTYNINKNKEEYHERFLVLDFKSVGDLIKQLSLTNIPSVVKYNSDLDVFELSSPYDY